MTDETNWAGHPRDNCYFCRDDCDVLETHHIVPRRFGGGNEDLNLVDLCPTCHEKLERLYDNRFYQSLGVGEPDRVVRYVTDYLITELNEIEIDMRHRFNTVRSRLEATHIKNEDAAEDLREQIDEAIQDYHVEEEGTEAGPADRELTHDEIRKVKTITDNIVQDYEEGAPLGEIQTKAAERGIAPERLEEVIDKLKYRGELYETRNGHYRVV